MPDSGIKAGVEGIAEEVKGRAKEAVGAVTGNRRLEEEGEAQQHKADAARDVARNEAKAERSRAEYEAHEAAQKANQ